ncbi:MAG: cysteine desulfurase-like protein [Chloroflexota bacterium]
MNLTHEEIRRQFPALHHTHNGEPIISLDGPAGTQQPESVIQAVINHMRNYNGSPAAPFPHVKQAKATVTEARAKMADFLNAKQPEEVLFGANMTTLTMGISRALAREWEPGDEIIVTRLDHEANVSPWMLAAEDSGATVRWLEFDTASGMMRLEQLDDLLSEKTKLLAIGYAANAIGSINDVSQAIAKAKAVGAMVFVDAVHYAPHDVIDVQALGCDFLVSSPYKYYAPHSGALWGKKEHLDHLRAYKLRSSPENSTKKWETGMPGFESIAGIGAALDYIGSLAAPQQTRRQQYVAAMQATKAYEMKVSDRFLRGAASIKGIRVYGNTDLERLDERTPTFAVRMAGYTPAELGAALNGRGVNLYVGHFSALGTLEALGLLESGGAVRLGFVHYNTLDEVDRLLTILEDLS